MNIEDFENKLLEYGFDGNTAGSNLRKAIAKINQCGGLKQLREIYHGIDKRDIPEFLIKTVGIENVVIVGLIANSDLEF